MKKFLFMSTVLLFSSQLFAALPTCGGTQGPDCMWANGKGCTLYDGHGNINQWPNSGDDNQCTGLVGPGGTGQLDQQYSADRKVPAEANTYDGFGMLVRKKVKRATDAVVPGSK